MCIFWSGCPHRAPRVTLASMSACLLSPDASRRYRPRAEAQSPFLLVTRSAARLRLYMAPSTCVIRGLVLLGAPLCFQPAQSQFRDALVSLVPPTLSDAAPFPGSLLSGVSALASPGTFIWLRLMDAALSLTDHHAMEIHARIERWTLDEIALPGKLVRQIVEWLYRENRLCRGVLKIGSTLVDPSCLSAPTLAIVNTADEIAPLGSIKPFIDAMPERNVRIMEYRGEVGVCLQHLGILVGRKTREGLARNHFLAQILKPKGR